LYRQARWVSRRIHPREGRELRADAEFYRTLFSPGSLCFDVGANVGEKSEAMLEAGARVVAFEPNPLVLSELRARCEQHRNWTLVDAALGNTPSISTLYARRGLVNSGLGQGGDVIGAFNVPVLTLDLAIQRFGEPTFCKIDVEGWELEVLQGLTRSVPLLSFEFQLGDRGIRKTLGCLEMLAGFGPALINVTPAETPRFHFREWIPLTEFLDWFPGDLATSLPGDLYGDIFVKRIEVEEMSNSTQNQIAQHASLA
jgi:FkbM family methyltransferase